MESNKEHQVWEQDDGPIDVQIGSCMEVVDIHNDKEYQLDKHLDQVGSDACQRNYQPREIDLTEDVCIGDEDIGGKGKGGTEIVPQHDTREVEQGLGCPIGRDACQATEHEHIHDGGEDGLDDKPQRTKDGLLVHRYNIALDVHIDQVAVFPDVFYV
jgi:hypothetical protein